MTTRRLTVFQLATNVPQYFERQCRVFDVDIRSGCVGVHCRTFPSFSYSKRGNCKIFDFLMETQKRKCSLPCHHCAMSLFTRFCCDLIVRYEATESSSSCDKFAWNNRISFAATSETCGSSYSSHSVSCKAKWLLFLCRLPDEGYLPTTLVHKRCQFLPTV